ncbi:hypothetical protein AGABI1DRAFT_21980, partial [Agaricus bisporus var. burnettii JB137-S8]
SLTSSMYWTVRSWLWNYPLTPDFKVWDEGDPNQYEEWVKERERTVRIWEFLAPYFAERGYKMYVRENLTDVFASRYPASSKIDPLELSYPYAQYACKNERQLEVALVVSGMGNPQILHAHLRNQSQRVWAARDREGRDVMLKLESSSLKALQLLHSEPLSTDPQNHTIPVIEYIEFNHQTFVVMPRWSSIVSSDFSTVGEIIRYARIFFEALAFLHENNITHGDITLQNMSMDVLMPCFRYPDYYVGHHGPERRYAFIDFEIAELPAKNGAPSPRFEECRRRDITWLATTLETHLRCIEHVAPGINEFLARMNKDAWDNLPDAATVLSDFDEICCRLSSSELTMPLEAYRWDHG